VTVTDVYGRAARISAAHLADSRKTLLPLFTPRGIRYVDTPENFGKRHIHRENIATNQQEQP
jgi:hypothetical protein